MASFATVQPFAPASSATQWRASSWRRPRSCRAWNTRTRRSKLKAEIGTIAILEQNNSVQRPTLGLKCCSKGVFIQRLLLNISVYFGKEQGIRIVIVDRWSLLQRWSLAQVKLYMETRWKCAEILKSRRCYSGFWIRSLEGCWICDQILIGSFGLISLIILFFMHHSFVGLNQSIVSIYHLALLDFYIL